MKSKWPCSVASAVLMRERGNGGGGGLAPCFLPLLFFTGEGVLYAAFTNGKRLMSPVKTSGISLNIH